MKNTSKFTSIVFLIGAIMLAACSQATTSTVVPSTLAATTTPFPTLSPVEGIYNLGHFPDVPTGSFSDSTVSDFQAVLDAAVKERGLPGVTATVLVADRGAWSGAAGTADGVNPIQVRS
jgi:CubicO group peptidase (beta-lactamase class C family)